MAEMATPKQGAATMLDRRSFIQSVGALLALPTCGAYETIAAGLFGTERVGPLFVWLGAISNDWYDPRNWLQGLIPTPDGTVVVNVGKDAAPLVIPVGTVIDTLQLYRGEVRSTYTGPPCTIDTLTIGTDKDVKIGRTLRDPLPSEERLDEIEAHGINEARELFSETA
jgi:hypothetical protein